MDRLKRLPALCPSCPDFSAGALFVAIVFYGLLLYRHALYGMYLMDEFVGSALGGDIFFGLRPYVDYMPFKTQIGYLLYGIPYALFSNIDTILLVNRHTAFLFAALMLCTIFQLNRAVFQSATAGLWTVFWTLTCSTFLEHAATIRVDGMATFAALLGVLLFVSLPTSVRGVAAGVCLGAAFCITQKSAYFILAFIASFWVVHRKAGFRYVGDFGLFALGGVAIFAVYGAIFGRGGAYLAVIKDTFNPDVAVSLTVASPYASIGKYYLQTFSRNVIFYCLAFAGIVSVLRWWRQSTWQQTFLALFTFGVLVLLLIHRHSWPYVFVLIIPLLGCFAGYLSDRIAGALRASWPSLVAPAVVVLVIVVMLHSVLRHQTYLQARSATQMPTIRAAEAILGPNDTYFDGVRMVGTRRPASYLFLHIGMLDKMLQPDGADLGELLEQLRKAECKVIIYNHRLAQLPAAFRRFLDAHYVLVDCNVFVSGVQITSSPAQVELIWPGLYSPVIYGSCTNLRIDDKPLTEGASTVFLSDGKHDVSFEGSGAVLLIPLRASQWIENNPIDPSVRTLFVNLYDL